MAGGTPYITPGLLLSRPAGISWTSIPKLTASSADEMAQLAQACWAATSTVDTYCRQPLRATAATETGTGPGQPRISVSRDTGVATLITRQWPVTQVLAVQVSPASAFPPQWTPVPAEQFRVRRPPVISVGPAQVTSPSGHNAIEVAPGYIRGDRGRGYWRVQYSYLSAWPHAGLTEDATEGVDEVQVDDVTGWAGVTGYAYGVPGEPVAVASAVADSPPQLPEGAGTVQAGPGTLTLAEPLTAAYKAGTIVSALPPVVLRASVLAATVDALEGINAIAVQSLSGQMAGGTGALATEMEYLLDDFRRWA